MERPTGEAMRGPGSGLLRGVFLAALFIAVGFLVGRLSAPETSVAPTPILRYGPPSLGPGQDALVVLHGDLVERVIREALEEEDLPFMLDQVETQYDASGLMLKGRAGVSPLGITVRGTLSTVIVPYARDDGTVGVTLSDTRAVGISLPGAAQRAIENAVNRELTRSTTLPGYSVADVELSDEALLVYLRIDQPFPTSRVLP